MQKYKYRVVSINLGNFGSTGKIARGVAEVAQKKQIEMFFCYPRGKSDNIVMDNDYVIESNLYNKIAQKLAYYTGLDGCFSFIATLKLVYKIKKINPAIIHIHNIHNNYVNVPLLFTFIRRSNIKVIWTFHDCWAFTGHCPHFLMEKCNKWKTGCYSCKIFMEYPHMNRDSSKIMWKLKKRWFTGIKYMTIVTPSQWLASLVKESYLRGYPIRVINNGIDLNVFKPTKNSIRQTYGIPQEKFLILGVAYGWGERKGLDVFIELSKRLDNAKYQIMLVGTDDNVDKILTENIISIHRTNNQTELAQIYTAADLFVNPTREENYPTVNMEAIACGTPVITFRTGGSPEIISLKSGLVIDCEDVDALMKEIVRISCEKPFSEKECIDSAKSFDMNERFEEYVQLYAEIQNNK